MELKQLEYFMVACEKGSFNQAAECLYTSQPNVSKVIGMLEQELGRALFERTSRGLRVTPYGETVREYAHNILNHVSLINSLAGTEIYRFYLPEQHDCEASDRFL